MGIQINGFDITGIRINGHDVVEAKVNNRVVWPEHEEEFTRLILEFTETTAIRFKITKLDDTPMLIDWGDGDSVTYNSIGNITTSTHTYGFGDYTITINAQPISWIFQSYPFFANIDFNYYLKRVILGKDYGATIPRDAFSNCKSLNYVKLSKSITTIGESAFRDCDELASIRLPNSVISIGNGAFAYCHNLSSIILSNNITFIDMWAFNECTSLTSIQLPSKISAISRGIFSDCSNLVEISIPIGVTSIGDWAFAYCTSLSKVTIPDTVVFIDESVFQLCSSLNSIYIPNSVTTIRNEAFYACEPELIINCGASSKPDGWGNSWNMYDPFNPSLRLTTNWGVAPPA